MPQRPRYIRMSDELYDAIDELAQRNGRSAAEEIRVGMEDWLLRAGNIEIEDNRRTVKRHGNMRQPHKMKDGQR